MRTLKIKSIGKTKVLRPNVIFPSGACAKPITVQKDPQIKKLTPLYSDIKILSVLDILIYGWPSNLTLIKKVAVVIT
jgi:hypothetical protein